MFDLAASLIKPFISISNTVGGTISTTTTTDVDANMKRYASTVTAGMISGSDTVLPAESFSDDNGDPLNAGGLVLPVDGYYNVYINGILQQEGLSVLTVNDLTVSAVLTAGVPVIIEVGDFAGTTSSSTSTQNLTVTSTINN